MRALKQLNEESVKKLEILQKVFTLTGGGKVDASTKAERKQEWREQVKLINDV